MKALFVQATGETFIHESAFGYFVRCDGRWYRQAAVARDRNTVSDGMQLEGANGPPNAGRVVYVEIAEPEFAGAEARVIDLPRTAEKRSTDR